jgi:hypothetical protein
MMRAFAAWLMRSRLNALVGAVVLRTLGLPSGAVIALTTLVQGPREGLRVMLTGALVLVGGGLALGVAPVLVLASVTMAWIPPLLMASALGATGTWSAALQAGAGLASLAVVLFHTLLDDPLGVSRQLLDEVHERIAALYQTLGVPVQMPAAAELDAVTGVVAGLFAALVLMGACGGLLLARWWQSELRQPGAFGTEFRALRNGRTTTAVASLVFVTTLFVAHPALRSVALVVLVPFLVQGLAVVHRVVRQKDMGAGWLVATYGLVLLAPQATWALLAGVGFADNWWNMDAAGGERPGA